MRTQWLRGKAPSNGSRPSCRRRHLQARVRQRYRVYGYGPSPLSDRTREVTTGECAPELIEAVHAIIGDDVLPLSGELGHEPHVSAHQRRFQREPLVQYVALLGPNDGRRAKANDDAALSWGSSISSRLPTVTPSDKDQGQCRVVQKPRAHWVLHGKRNPPWKNGAASFTRTLGCPAAPRTRLLAISPGAKEPRVAGNFPLECTPLGRREAPHRNDIAPHLVGGRRRPPRARHLSIDHERGLELPVPAGG